MWQSVQDVERIVCNGFHFVAKPQAGQPTWRFSLSMAEVQLSNLIPGTARKCLLALKVILKDNLQPVVPDISSYHIKTIVLFTLEKQLQNVWQDENINFKGTS